MKIKNRSHRYNMIDLDLDMDTNTVYLTQQEGLRDLKRLL